MPISRRHRRSALLGATVLASAAGACGARAAQLPIVVQQTADTMLAGLQIPATAPTQGMWSPVQPWPINAVSLVLMPNGKITSYGTPVNNPSIQNGMTYDVWDPTQGFAGTTSHTQYYSGPFVNSFCSAQAFQADGSLMISGGIFDSGVDKGTAVVNASSNGVTQLTAKLADDRYYATMITRPDGTQLIMGGSYPYLGGAADPQGSIDKGYMTGMTPETYSPLTGWTSLFGATSRDAFGPDNQRWWYPRAWVAPNNKIFGISADNMWYLDPTGAGSIVAMPFKPPQAAATVATAAPNVGPVSTAVMYDVGKILQVGGNSYDNYWGFLSSSVATTVNINGASPVVADTAPMNFGRAWANSTVLPTGKVFVNGGSLYDNNAGAQAVLAAETWDPATGQWTVGPSQALYRGYHSTAALMLDGTVMTAGGGAPGPVNNKNVEIYYPPYMFTTLNGQAALAPRPQIVSLSTNRLLYAQSMQVEVQSATSLSQVVLIGLSQVTHSFNTGQRRIPLSFSQSGSIVTAQTPASAALAPPGYYQVIAIDAKGVPSTGAVVAIGGSVAAPVVESTPTGVVSANVSGMTQCAVENATCTFSGTQNVLFGANGAYASMTATGSISCSNGTFGLDPIFGTVKACYVPASSAVSSGGTATASAGGSTTSGSPSTGASTGSANGATAASNGGTSAAAPASTPITGNWTGIGVSASRIASGSDGTIVVTNANDNSVWQYVSDNNWVRLPLMMKYVAVRNAKSIWGIGMDNNIYRFDGSSWTLVGYNVSSISIAADGTVVVSKPNYEIWYKTTDDTQQNWLKLPNWLAFRVAAMSAKSVWFVGLDNNVYRTDLNGNGAGANISASEIGVSTDGSVLVTNPSTQQIWRKTGDNTANTWSAMQWKALSVAAGMSGHAYSVGMDTNVYRY